MAYQVITAVSKAGETFESKAHAVSVFMTAVSLKENTAGASEGTIKHKVADNPNVTRTVELLEDATGFQVTDVWTDQATHDAYYDTVRPGYQAAGVTAGEGIDGWLRTVISSEEI